MTPMTRLLLVATFATILPFTGCEQASDEGGNDSSPVAEEQKAPDLGRPLGTMNIEGSNLQVHGKGVFRAGARLELTIQLVDGATPSSIHAWVGPRSGKDVEKIRADGDDRSWRVNVDVPGTVTDTTMLWIEVEGKDGKQDSRGIRMR